MSGAILKMDTTFHSESKNPVFMKLSAPGDALNFSGLRLMS